MTLALAFLLLVHLCALAALLPSCVFAHHAPMGGRP